MKKTLYLLFNHRLTPIQEQDAIHSLGVSSVKQLPDDLKLIWGNIPPELTKIASYIEPIKGWLNKNAKKNDYILIQGDFGACYQMVTLSFEKEYIPIYSTTERLAKEKIKHDGTIELKHQFKHAVFRRYGE